MRAPRLAALATLLVTIASLQWLAPAAGAAGTVLSGFSDFHQMLFADGSLFVSPGTGTKVAMLDAVGTVHAYLKNLSNPAGMAVVGTTLYVAETGASRITPFDLTTDPPTREASMSIAPLSEPTDLAYAGGKLWFVMTCDQWGGKIGSMDLNGSNVTDQTPAGSPSWTYCPSLDHSAFAPDRLFPRGNGISPQTLYEYDVSSGSLVETTHDDFGWGNYGGQATAVLPSGTQFIMASASGFAAFGVDDMAGPSFTYSTGTASPSNSTLAVTGQGGGRIAGLVTDSNATQIRIWKVGTAKATTILPVGPSTGVWDGGLAWDATGTYVYVATDTSTGGVAVQRSNANAKAATVTLSASPSKIAYGKNVKLTAHLHGGSTGRDVSIYAKIPGATAKLVGQGTVNGSGYLTLSYAPKEKTTFTASYAGDDAWLADQSPGVTVAVRAGVTTRMLQKDGTSGRYALYHYAKTCPGSTHANCPIIGAFVKPDHTSENVTILVQGYRSGSWRKVAKGSFTLVTGSYTAGVFYYSDQRVIGIPLRARTTFPGDARNLNATSPWAYFKVTR